ncbi:MAG: hypothetical protein E6J34_14390 [Chloroflexi bacterium]|nr:MAG: hypothetical protein E6J34_14390 [Chloroflexota bacterium]
MGSIMKRAPVREILWLFLLTRLLPVIVTYFGYILLTAAQYSSAPVDATFFSTWNHWDAANYVRIAQYGYTPPYDFAFFPLFPLLISIIAHILGSWSYQAVGMILSNMALLGTMLLLYQLAVESAGEEVARRTLLYLCIFPTAFYFFAAYNESLFLLFTTATFLALRRRRWWLAGLLGCCAALTRSAGILLVLPYLYELWVAREHITLSIRIFLRSAFSITLIPLGTACYALYCWHMTSNPLIFVAVQAHWHRHLSWPWQGLWNGLFELFWNQPFGSASQAHILLDLSATLCFILLTVLGWRKLRTSYTIWAGTLLLYILLSPATELHDWLMSNQRFVLEMFPAFITLASLSSTHPTLHKALLLIFPTLFATLSLIFVMNRWLV